MGILVFALTFLIVLVLVLGIWMIASGDNKQEVVRRRMEAVRKAEDSHWRRSNPEALSRARNTVDQIRTAITQLERQLAKAEANGDTSAQEQAREALQARQSWLAEAERTLAEFSG